MKNLKPLFAIVTIGLALSFMTACGGNSDRNPEAQEMSSSPAALEEQSEAQPAGKLNLNTASDEQFSSIPGVGDRMIREFREYRPYISIQQFRQEIGKYVDEDQVAAYEQYLFVPIDPNESDAATLQQIPGLDASEAEEVIAGRPYESNEAFLDALSTYINEEERTTAEQYLASE